MKGLSRVVQGRLHPDNDEEREALEVLEQWEKAGHSTRQVITQALRVLGNYDVAEPDAVTAIRHMMRDMQDSMVEAVVKLLEDRIEDLAAMAPAERRVQVQRAARSTFGKSILNAIDVAEYEGSER